MDKNKLIAELKALEKTLQAQPELEKSLTDEWDNLRKSEAVPSAKTIERKEGEVEEEYPKEPEAVSNKEKDASKEWGKQVPQKATMIVPTMTNEVKKGECMVKDDQPHPAGSPEDSAHDVVEEGSSLKDELSGLANPREEHAFFEHLRSLKEPGALRSPENEAVGQDPNAPQLDKATGAPAAPAAAPMAPIRTGIISLDRPKKKKPAMQVTSVSAIASPQGAPAMAKAKMDDGKSPAQKLLDRHDRSNASQHGSLKMRVQSGIHKPLVGDHGGTSEMGGHGRNAPGRKVNAQRVLSEIKAQPKPNLPKAEAPMAKAQPAGQVALKNGKKVDAKKWSYEKDGPLKKIPHDQGGVRSAAPKPKKKA